MLRLGLLAAATLMLAAFGASLVLAQDAVEVPFERATFVGNVRCAVDNTAAMQARNALLDVPKTIHAVPQGPRPPFAGRSGPRFQGAPEPIRALFGSGSSSAFPGPNESGLTPGDPQLSAGPNHVVACINGQIAFYQKDGTNTFSVSPNAFFASLGGYYLIFDPRTFYDTYTQRFWVLYPAILNGSWNKSYFLVALSDDSDPNGNWTLWALDSSMNGSQNTTNWSDYPGFGHTQDAIVFTANMYTSGWGWAYGKVRVALKQQFLNGSPNITYTDFWNFTDASGAQAASMQPARTKGMAHMPYFCSAGGNNRINVWGIQNVTTTPTLVARQVLVSTFSAPPNARQQGGSVTLWTVDSRIFDVQCRDNRLTILHNVDQGGYSALRWYELDAWNMPTSVSLVQSGVLSAANTDQYFGALAMNGCGHMGAAFSRSSSSEYISIYGAVRYADAALGTFGAPYVIRAGTRYYTGEGGGNVRWGDYSGLCVDGGDDISFWGLNMVPDPASPALWVTEIFRIDPGRTATISGAVTLEHYTASPAGISGILELRAPSTTTVLHSYPVTLDSSGTFLITPAYFGSYDVALKLSHWLRTVVPATITSGTNYVLMTMKNGDVVPDNSVDLLDINKILAWFGTADPMSDLNGSGMVDLVDLNITLMNFGLVGQP
ncbi:MAG: hypothetical protein HRF45_05485 [Fimbriimonadia bacterium]|jgi:hypothetical protein